MTQREAQMVSESISGPITLIEDSPLVMDSVATTHMLFRNAMWPVNGCLNGKRMNERSPSGQPCADGNGAVLKDGNRRRRDEHVSKIYHECRKWHLLYGGASNIMLSRLSVEIH